MVWVEAFSCTSPIFFRKKIPQSTFPPVFSSFKLWPRAHPHLPSSLFAGGNPQLRALQTPVLLMNKHHSICGAQYISETMFSFKVCRIAWSGFVNDPSGVAFSGWGAKQWCLSDITKHKELSPAVQTAQEMDFFFLYVIFCLLKLCKPGKYNNCFC